MFLVFVRVVRASLVIGCLPGFWCLCTLSGHLWQWGAWLVFVKLAFGQLSFITNHVSDVCVLRLAMSCHWVLALYL